MRTRPATPACDQSLSETWYRARFDPILTTQSEAEDALFCHYLPLATDLAERYARIHGNLTRALQAAEVGLARSILDWRHSDCSRFESFARLAIERSLRGRATAIDGRPRRDLTGPAR
jgi:DNA-directed RNA polymerase specialized sigma subunit